MRYLRDSLGFQCFVTLGPVAPNYGAYFGIASINHNDLPTPQDWVSYVARHLDPNAPAITFIGTNRNDPNGPSASRQLVTNIDAYQATGVRYVLIPGMAPDRRAFAPFEQYAEKTAMPACVRSIAIGSWLFMCCRIPRLIAPRRGVD